MTFGAEGKERTLEMVQALEKALGEDIQGLDWMTPATKTAARSKSSHAIANKIGYPDKWRDYVRRRGRAATTRSAMSQRANEFEFQRQLDKIGKPVDRNEWLMTPADRQRLLRAAG